MIQTKKNQKLPAKRKRASDFAQKGERALVRAAKKVAVENKNLGLPLVLLSVHD